MQFYKNSINRMLASSKIKSLTSIDQIWEYYQDDLHKVENHIRKVLDSQGSLIAEVGQYILNSGGKRIRPLLVIISSRLNGERRSDQADILLASAVEFIHTASLLHDDVIDDAAVRRGKPSAHLLWNNQTSILVGDHLYAQGVSCAASLANHELNNALLEACSLMTKGETLQLTYQGNLKITEEEYLQVIQYKTAALISTSCRLGGIISALEPQKEEALAKFGLYLGIAYQLVDDTLDYIADEHTLGKSLRKDLKKGEITLPLLHLLTNCEEHEREWVQRLLKMDEITQNDAVDILMLIKRYGSIKYSMNKARELVEIAKKNLCFYPDTAQRQALLTIADYVVARDH